MVWPRRQCGHPILPRDGDNPAGNACPGVALPVSKRGRASSLRHKEGIFRARKRYLGGLRAGTRRLSRLSLPGEEVRSFLFTPPPLDFYFTGLKRLGGCCAKAPKKFQVRPLPLPRGGPAASPDRRHSRDSGRGSGCFPRRSAAKSGRAPAFPGLDPGPGPGWTLGSDLGWVGRTPPAPPRQTRCLGGSRPRAPRGLCS